MALFIDTTRRALETDLDFLPETATPHTPADSDAFLP
jgi:hypothetical protein